MIFRNSSVLFLILLCYSCPSFTDELPTLVQLDITHIEQQKVSVAKELKKTYYSKIGIAAAFTGALGYAGYKLFFPNTPIVAPVPLDEQKVTSLDDIKKQIDLYHEVIIGQRDLLAEQGVAKEFSFWLYLKSWAKYVGPQLVIVGLASVVNRVMLPLFPRFDSAVDAAIYKLFHTNDINWFVTTHSDLANLTSQLENHVELLTSNISAEQMEYHRDGFARTWTLYIQHLEAILGFMSYKTAILAQHSMVNGERAQALADRLIKRINQVAPLLQTYNNAIEFTQETSLAFKNQCSEVQRIVQESLASYSAFEILSLV